MRVSNENIIKTSILNSLKDINTCTVGIVVSVDDLKKGFIAVRPLINYISPLKQSSQSSSIYYVSPIMPSTSSCGMVLPIKVGDTCLLVFGKDSFSQFKQGNTSPHNPDDLSKFSDDNAVAFMGFNTTQESLWNSENHSEEYSESSVKVFNNKGTPSECFIELKESGDVDVRSPTQINANAPVVNAKDVIIEGVGSVKQFMLSHTHNYTDDGSPMVTQPPNTM